jgi:hypothetical protein
MSYGRDRLARDHRQQQKKSQLRDVERIGDVKAEFRRKDKVRRCQTASE